MSTWLTPLRAALDEADRPVTLFFRDDDAGWDDDRLDGLLDVFVRHAAPIDLAAIPTAMTARLARGLSRRPQALVGIHQHGYAHANHERAGRSCEFGPGRSREAQLGDIAHGRALLRRRLGAQLQPIFTPPWNRCTSDTAECLVALGIDAISRDRTAGALAVPGLQELPVQVDWLARRRGERLGRAAVGEQLAARAREPQPLGVMLHHAEMGADDLRALDELLGLVADHERARCRSMAEILHATAVVR